MFILNLLRTINVCVCVWENYEIINFYMNHMKCIVQL